MRKLLFQIHRYLALIFSLPLIVMAVTGAILTFAPKDKKVSYGDPKTSLASSLKKIRALQPDSHFLRVQFTPQTLTLMLKKTDVALIKWDRVKDELISVSNPKDDLFVFSKIIHESLLLQKPGKKIVGLSGLGLFIILLSGTLFWVRPKLTQQLKKLYNFRNVRKLKEFHVMLGLFILIPLHFASLSGFFIEYNGLFFTDQKAVAHIAPITCSWEQQLQLLESSSLPSRGMIQFCRPDFFYLTLADQNGTHQLTPTGEEVLFVAKDNWQAHPGHRKHFFVHWHSGENFKAMESPYLYFTSSSLFLLIISGFLLWIRKKNIFRRKV